MSTLTSTANRPAVTALRAGLLLTVLAMLAVLVDQATGDLLGSHIQQTYPQYGPAELDRDKSVLLTYQFTVGALGVLCWLWLTWAVTRGKRWARGAATVAFLLGTSVLLFDLFVTEYGRTVLPPLHGVAQALPGLAGLVAIVLLWTRGR